MLFTLIHIFPHTLTGLSTRVDKHWRYILDTAAPVGNAVVCVTPRVGGPVRNAGVLIQVVRVM